MSKEEAPIEVRGLVWLGVGEQNLGGAGRMDLLEQIRRCGSITQAAKALQLSYKAAWDAIDHMNNLAGEPLVQRAAGGKGGGGTRLTARGAQLLANFRLIQAEHERFMRQLAQQAQHLGDDLLLLRSLSMRTSARNHFRGRVSAIKHGAVNDEVRLDLGHGLHLVAIVTCESRANLGLELGSEAYALVKASSVLLLPHMAEDAAPPRLSARNCLLGRVQRLTPGAVNAEVVLELEHGLSLAAIVTQASLEELGLELGAPVWAAFKASSVIVATPA